MCRTQAGVCWRVLKLELQAFVRFPACYLGDELWFSWLHSKHPNSLATSSLSDFKGHTDFTCNTCLLLEARGLGVQVIIAYREYSLDYM